MNALEAAKVAEAALEDKLGEDIKVLDLRGLSNIADCFVIASGKNANQLHAMANEVEQKLFVQRTPYMMPITISRVLLKEAFLSEAAMQSFIG